MLIIFFGSIIGWGLEIYYSKTKAVANYGGEYIEGVVGQPMHINPVLSSSNNTDDSLVQIVYSSLLEYDGQGNIKNDLAESYEISEDKTLYTFRLKNNVLWHDGEPLTAEDVLFTINLISDPAYKSPLRANWQGIETAAVDDHTLTFQIKTPYAGFLNNLTFGILPKHIWESISPEKFPLADLNLEPIGTGPYKYAAPFQKDSNGNIISYKLAANPNYFKGKPYISKLTFNFYPDDESVLSAYNKKEVMGISSLSPQKMSQLKLPQSTLTHKFNVPRYFAVFFNKTKSFALANDEVREALAYATDRREIIDQVLAGNGSPIYSPVLPGMPGYSEDLGRKDFDLNRANQVLEEKQWAKREDGVREKNGAALEINLVTTDWPELSQTADLLKAQWEKVGAQVTINALSISDVQQNYIRTREYDALLFGQVLGADPDPFSFWHSSQKKDPGLNLAVFGNSDTDKLIEDGRAEFDAEKRSALYQEFQKKLTAEMPAVFLYSPEYIYPINKKMQGIDIQNLVSPASRFADINQWYIKTKRVKK